MSLSVVALFWPVCGDTSLLSWPPSPCWCVMWSTSSPACGHLCVFFGKLAAQAFCPVSGWAARFLGPELRERLCVWRLAPRWLCRSEVCSPVQGVLLVVSPVVRKLLITPRLLLHLFPLPSELIQENVSCGLCASVPPMFSSSSLMVSGLTFRSLTHFGFIFVYGVRRCSGFIVFHGAVQLSQRQGPGSRGGAGRACVCVCACVCIGGVPVFCLCQWEAGAGEQRFQGQQADLPRGPRSAHLSPGRLQRSSLECLLPFPFCPREGFQPSCLLSPFSELVLYFQWVTLSDSHAVPCPQVCL